MGLHVWIVVGGSIRQIPRPLMILYILMEDLGRLDLIAKQHLWIDMIELLQKGGHLLRVVQQLVLSWWLSNLV